MKKRERFRIAITTIRRRIEKTFWHEKNKEKKID